jgi:pimeloyl-ACP methyl ester carboxylesterase
VKTPYQLNLAGCECEVVEFNPSANVVAFALHGWLDNIETFRTMAAHMPEIRLIAVDFPGHGHSNHLPEKQIYHFIDGLYLIDDLRAHFQPSQINIIGHSMGGALGCLYAASQKSKVAKLVMIDSLGPLSATLDESTQLLTNSIRQRAKYRPDKPVIYKTVNEVASAKSEVSVIQPQLLEALVERSLKSIEGGYTWRTDPRLRHVSSSRMTEEQITHLISQIETNVLLLEAEQGFIKNSQSMQARKNYFKNLEIFDVKGGHHMHLEHPKFCGETIQAFLTRK